MSECKGDCVDNKCVCTACELILTIPGIFPSTGNVMLLRVLPAVYEKQPQPINRHLTELLALMSQLGQPEQYHLLRLLHVAAKRKQPEVKSISHIRWSTHPGMFLGMRTRCVLQVSSLMRPNTPIFKWKHSFTCSRTVKVRVWWQRLGTVLWFPREREPIGYIYREQLELAYMTVRLRSAAVRHL